MKILRDTLKNSGTIYHAYIIEGEKDIICEKLLVFIEKDLKHPTQGNPDFWHEKFEMLGIDDARSLRDMQLVKPIAFPRKIFILEVFGMTVEAQNALLKMFEEPAEGTHFFLIADSADIFLPTLRSRMIVVRDDEMSEGSKKFVKEFIAASPAERLELVAPIIEEKNKAQAVELIDGLIKVYGQKNQTNASLLRELLTLRSYLNDRSPSLKLILEHISLILPI